MNDVRREKYQVMPALPAEDYEALKADIAARGVMVAIEVDEYGNILDGYNRIKVCRELGINDYPVVVRSGLSEAEKLTHARRVNLLRRRHPSWGDPSESHALQAQPARA
jgi:ParB-like chromosome segregation protein Spo0J